MIHVSDHAVLRYVERVLGVDVDDVRRQLSSPAIVAAAEFGAREVILATGHHAVLVGTTVVTVRPRIKRKCRRVREVEE